MMDITLTTERLLLRPYRPSDFSTVHAYASDMENVWFMPFGPNTERETFEFLERKFKEQEQEPPFAYDFAICLKDTGEHIGGGGIYLNDERNVAHVGWVFRKDHWKRGYGTEFCAELLRFGFDDLKLHRIYARCNADNYGSYRVMERNRMRREAHFKSVRYEKVGDHKEWTDELVYAILADEWEVSRDIDRCNAMPVTFDGFIDIPVNATRSQITDDTIELVCTAKHPPNDTKNVAEMKVPMYSFDIVKGGEKIGDISLRIGYCDRLYYGGQIGYNIDEAFRGNGYAAAACRLLVSVAKAHGMNTLFITNNPENHASVRVCEKLGANLIRVAPMPEWHDSYEKYRFCNIFEWKI